MKIQRIQVDHVREADVAAAAAVLRAGGMVLFPSDTCYGLAVDPAQPAALERLYAIKLRPRERAVSCVFESIDAIAEYALVGTEARRVLELNLPGPFTFLLPPLPDAPLPFPMVGARIPRYPPTRALARSFGRPYTATSANISGREPCYRVEDFIRQCTDANVTDLPDLALDAGELPRTPPSTVVDLSTENLRIVRPGAGTLLLA